MLFNYVDTRVQLSTYTVPDVFSLAAMPKCAMYMPPPPQPPPLPIPSQPTSSSAGGVGFYAKITFHLLNVGEFTARTASLRLKKDVISILKRVPGFRFDHEKKRFVFPISEHNKLKVALSSMGIYVEALPPITLAAITLKQKKKEATYIEVGGEIVQESASMVLSPLLPERLLSSLAPFQQEGVAMILQNEGRAMVIA